MKYIEDYYTWYVHVLGINEELFWSSDVSLIMDIASNIVAFDVWKRYAEDDLRERIMKQNGKR